MTATDPRIATWHGSNVAAMIALLGDGADEEKLRAWVQACRELYDSRYRKLKQAIIIDWIPIENDRIKWHASNWGESNFAFSMPLATRAALLRCLFPPPYPFRERVTCPACDGTGEVRFCDAAGDMDNMPCMRCEGTWVGYRKGSGTIPGPLMDPRWLSSNVMDLARAIRGDALRRVFETHLVQIQGKRIWRNGAIKVWLNPPYPDFGERIDLKCVDEQDKEFGGKTLHGMLVIGSGRNQFDWNLRQDELSIPTEPPHPERMPVLADELEITGCDCEEILAHCRAETHVNGCWVIDSILSA